MEYVKLGRAGIKVSRLGLGSSNFGLHPEKPFALDIDRTEAVVARAWELGINFFDSAETYMFGEAERVLGEALRRVNPPREEIVVQTKCGPGSVRFKVNRSGLSRKHLLNAIDESLERLQLDFVDLYTIHRLDGETPFEETCEVLHEIVKSGKARYIGISSAYAWQVERMLGIQERNGWTKFVVMQNQYALNYREEEREMIPLLIDRGMAMTPWGILSAGLLAGNIQRDGTRSTIRAKTDLLRGEKGFVGNTEQDFDIQDKVRAIAEKRGASMAEVGMAWALSKPFIQSCLIGASSPRQIDSSVAALDMVLSAEDIAFLEEGYQPVNVQTIGSMMPVMAAK